MSDRRDRDRKGRGSRSPSRSRSRSNHKKKNQKQKHKKNKKYNRSYSRSSSYSRSRSRSLSDSPSPKKEYSQKYAKKTDKVERIEKEEKADLYSAEKQATAVPVQAPGYQPTQEESSCLIITGLTEDITQDQLEDLLRDIAISLQTSPPDSIQMVSVFKTAYAVFPSVEAAKKILLTMRGKIDNGTVNLELEFYPTNLSNPRSAASSKDVSLVQDWICDKCEYKNFAKRTKCHKCENPRNNNCKVVYNSACYIKQPNAPQSSAFPNAKQSNTQEGDKSNNSVMVRGAILQDISETTLLDFFNQYAPVKDIRMVRNKTTGRWKDFAFIEFFSVEEAERVLKASQEQEFRISGQPVTVAFSRTKKREDEHSYGTDEVSPHPTYQQQSRQYYGSYNSNDVNYMNASADTNSNYYAQNYYNQQLNQYAQQYASAYDTAGTAAANMQQYMQNYGQGYNYNQAYAQAYGGQNYAAYGNYGYDANSQSYARQAYTQQLQQQLQPSTIQQTIQQQAKPQTQQQQLQVQLPALSTAATSTPLYQTMPQTQSEKKPEPLIHLPKVSEPEKVQETPSEKENVGNKEKMQVEEKNPEISGDNVDKKETPMQEEKEEKKEDSSTETQQKEDGKAEKGKGANSKLNKVDEEKAKRKQIEMEMKKWEREQQMKAMMGPGQEEQESQQQQTQQSQQPKKAEMKSGPTQEADKMAPVQVQNKQKSTIFSSSSADSSGADNNEALQEKIEAKQPKKEAISYKVFLGETPVCRLCKRKFNDEYSIKLHEKFSKLHRDNLEKVSTNH